jgi:hypothetical protein
MLSLSSRRQPDECVAVDAGPSQCGDSINVIASQEQDRSSVSRRRRPIFGHLLGIEALTLRLTRGSEARPKAANRLFGFSICYLVFLFGTLLVRIWNL